VIALRLLAACVIIVLAALGPLAAAARETTGGTIYLTTFPSGADTWVDGAYVGHSPVLVDALSLGKHTITAAKTGWRSHEMRVMVSEREPFQFINFSLERDPSAATANGTLALHAGAPFRTLTVDGNPVRPSAGGKVDLAPGDHEITVDMPSGRFARHVTIYPETTTNVLIRAGTASGDRAVVVAPVSNYLPQSDVVVDGKRISIRHNGHTVSGVVGDATMRIDGGAMTFDTPPAFVGGKLFLPLDLYVRIGAVPLRPHSEP